MNTPVTFGTVKREAVPIRALNAKPGPARAKHILLVDDDELFLDLAATVLTQAGYNVDTAGDGEAGWIALRARDYDLLITDNDMPRLTGVELVMRARQAGMAFPAVMASGSSMLAASHVSGWLDLAAFLPKPFAIQELADLVSRIVSLGPALDPVDESTGPQPDAVLFGPPRGDWERWGLNE